MKLLTEIHYNCVNFHGIEILVHPDVVAIAVNKGGEIHQFFNRPSVLEFNGAWEDYYEDDGLYCGEVDLEGMDWRDTLVEV